MNGVSMFKAIKSRVFHIGYLAVPLLCLGVVSCKVPPKDSPRKQRLEWQKNCKGFEYYYVEIEGSSFTRPLRFKIPAYGATGLRFKQTEQQRATTPPDIFCAQPEVRFLKVNSINLNHGLSNDGEINIMPKGAFDVSLPSSHRFRCHQTFRTTKQTELENIFPRSCRMLGEIPDWNIKFNYRIHTYPPDYTKGGSLERDKWPYKFYPEDTWPMVEEDIRSGLKNLLYQDP